MDYERIRRFFFWAGVLAGVAIFIMAMTGCQRGDIQLSPVFEDQAAPHAGWNFGPDSYLDQGDQVKVTGVVLWLKGTDPNDLFPKQ